MRIAEVREKYPDAKQSREGVSVDAYCVGGALCLFLNHGRHWPGREELADALEEANPNLDSGNALRYASMIIHENDLTSINNAWKVLGEALRWKP